MNKSLLQFLLLTGACATAGYFIGKTIGDTEEEKKRNAMKGLLIGAGGGILIAGACTTVNYILKRRGRIVYHGITKADRLESRLNEHRANGKIFDNYEVSYAKPRQMAMSHERTRILRDRPKYNIQHNCN